MKEILQDILISIMFSLPLCATIVTAEDIKNDKRYIWLCVAIVVCLWIVAIAAELMN